MKDFYEEHHAKLNKMTPYLLKRIKLTEETIRKYGEPGEILEIAAELARIYATTPISSASVGPIAWR